MFRISKQADYGIVLLSHIAQNHAQAATSAKDLAADTGFPQPMVAKILKQLTRGGLLLSQRGAGGGYSLSRRAAEVSVAEILEVMREPVGLVDCCPGAQRTCSHERSCPMKDPLQRLNAVVIQALQGLTLGELVSAA